MADFFNGIEDLLFLQEYERAYNQWAESCGESLELNPPPKNCSENLKSENLSRNSSDGC